MEIAETIGLLLMDPSAIDKKSS